MLFDKLAGFVEKNMPEAVANFKRAALFEFPFKAADVIKPGQFTQTDLDNFYLPFPVVAVEDNATCTLLTDSEDHQFGFSKHRMFIDIVNLGIAAGEMAPGSTAITENQRQMARDQGLHQVAFGEIHTIAVNPDTNRYQISAKILYIEIIDKNNTSIAQVPSDELQTTPQGREAYHGIIQNVITAIEEIMLINGTHDYFIFEKSPVKQRKEKTGRILRSHDRPNYTVLKPNEIRAILGVKQPTDQQSTRQPHERRRHWRHLTSERYTNKRWQKILIDAVWVGPSQATIGNHHYKVRLDI